VISFTKCPIQTLSLSASLSILRERDVGECRRVAEVLIRKVPDEQQFLDVRVAVLGCADAGKSTLLGVVSWEYCFLFYFIMFLLFYYVLCF
jgi:GTPase